jgi:hypothetical protein
MHVLGRHRRQEDHLPMNDERLRESFSTTGLPRGPLDALSLVIPQARQHFPCQVGSVSV